MLTALPAAVLAGVLIGVVMGALGGGGAVLLVPVLALGFGVDAVPATTIGPGDNWASGAGRSMRLAVRIGPFSPQSRSVQYAVARSNRVTSQSTTHLVAET